MHPLLQRFLVGSPYKNTLSKHANGVDKYLGVATILAAAFLGLGITSPLAYSDEFYGLNGSFSLITAVTDLMKSGAGSYALGIGVIFVALPILNISSAFDFWYKHPLDSEKFDRFFRRVNACNRLWFIMFAAAAFLVYEINSSTGGIIYPPIYYLIISILLQKFALIRMSRMASVVQFVEDNGD